MDLKTQIAAINKVSARAQGETFTALREAANTLSALNLIVGKPEKFRKDLHTYINRRLTVEYHGLLEEQVLKFLKDRGLPI